MYIDILSQIMSARNKKNKPAEDDEVPAFGAEGTSVNSFASIARNGTKNKLKQYINICSSH